MRTRDVDLSKQRQVLEFLFSNGELLKIVSNIWLFFIIEFGLIFSYIQLNVSNLLIISLSYSFIFFISLILYKKYRKIKKNLFNRYTEIKNMISQELYNGEKLTNWQNELDSISDFLEQQGLLKRSTALRE